MRKPTREPTHALFYTFWGDEEFRGHGISYVLYGVVTVCRLMRMLQRHTF